MFLVNSINYIFEVPATSSKRKAYIFTRKRRKRLLSPCTVMIFEPRWGPSYVVSASPSHVIDCNMVQATAMISPEEYCMWGLQKNVIWSRENHIESCRNFSLTPRGESWARSLDDSWSNQVYSERTATAILLKTITYFSNSVAAPLLLPIHFRYAILSINTYSLWAPEQSLLLW